MMRTIKPLLVTYDESVDAAYIYLTEIRAGEVAKTYCCDPSEVDGQIHLDFDADGQLLGIEVLGAKSKLPAAILEQS
jgi:uncharacterized protein YuzE